MLIFYEWRQKLHLQYIYFLVNIFCHTIFVSLSRSILAGAGLTPRRENGWMEERSSKVMETSKWKKSREEVVNTNSCPVIYGILCLLLPFNFVFHLMQHDSLMSQKQSERGLTLQGIVRIFQILGNIWKWLRVGERVWASICSIRVLAAVGLENSRWVEF